MDEMVRSEDKAAAASGGRRGFLSSETIEGRSSPELWNERVRGLAEFVAQHRSSLHQQGRAAAAVLETGSKRPPVAGAAGAGSVNFEKSDVSLLSEFSSLSPKAILDKLEQLQHIAYELGLQELHEVNRGRFLALFNN